MTEDFAPFLSDLKIETVAPGILLSARFDPEHLHSITPPFDVPDRIAQAVVKRRADFTAGRLLAHLGQEMFGRAPQVIEVAPSRAPIWPDGLSGSISHAKNHAVVWLCDDPQVSLGIDIEAVASGRALEAIAASVLEKSEIEIAASDPEAMTAGFSAKETLFKALHPQVGRFFGFSAAEMIAISGDQITLELKDDLGLSLPKETVFNIIRETKAPGVLTRLAVSGPCAAG